MAQKAIQRNGCYEHTKLVLKAMLHDERPSFRTRAADKILELRNNSCDGREAEVEAKRKDEEEGEQGGAEEGEEGDKEEDKEEEENGLNLALTNSNQRFYLSLKKDRF